MAGSDQQATGPSPVSRFARDLLAGGMSGIIAKTIAAPIDRVKLLMQTQRINAGLAVPYRNPIDCVLRIHQSEGLLSFWRGNLANVYRYFPSQALNFAFKDKYTDLFGGLTSGGGNLTSAQEKYRRMIVSLVSGGLAGATALFVSYPFDVARTRLAVDVTRAPEVVSSRSPGPPSSARAPSVSAGAGSSGVHSSAAHVAPVSSGTAGAVSTLISHAGARSLSTAASTASTAIAPPASASSSSGGSGGSGTSGRRVYGGTFDCLRSTYQLEGVRGVYSGFGVSLAGVILFRALYLGGYDIVKDHYELEHASRSVRFLAAQAVTTVVGTLCFPIDTVKRRLMVQRKLPAIPTAPLSPASTTALSGLTAGSTGAGGVSSAAAAVSGPSTRTAHVPYRSGWDCLRRILAEEGVRGLFAGLSVNLVRGVTGAILLVAYDDFKKLM